MTITAANAEARANDLVRDWRIAIERRVETARSILIFGTRDALPIVLKVAKYMDEEWHAGAVLAAFQGRGAIQVYEHTPGAVLLERLRPAFSLGEDE